MQPRSSWAHTGGVECAAPGCGESPRAAGRRGDEAAGGPGAPRLSASATTRRRQHSRTRTLLQVTHPCKVILAFVKLIYVIF